MSKAAFYSNKERNQGTMSFMLSPDNHPKHYDPLPRSRTGISTDAQDFLQRDRGQMSTLLDHSQNTGYCTGRRSPNVKGSAAQEIMRRSSGSSMASAMNLNDNRGYATARPAPRVKPEALDIANRNAGSMRLVLDNAQNRGYNTSRPAQRVKPEAEQAAVKNSGTMHILLDSNQNKQYYSNRSKPRVKPEAEMIATKNKGQMNLVLSSDSPLTDNAVPRVKPEAASIYNRNRGTLTSDTYNYGHIATDPQPAPKNKGEGRSIAQLGTSGTVSKLLTHTGSERRSVRPASRVKRDGVKYARQGKGTIGELLGTQGKAGRRSAMW